MSDFISVIIILLAMLIQAFLALNPGLFAIFYHYALGKTSTKKADDAALSYILGTEIFTSIIFIIIYIIINLLTINQFINNHILAAILAGIFIAEALIVFFFYFKRTKKSTELFLSRRIAKSLIAHAKNSRSRSDTIILGIITTALEFFFTLPLYIIISIEILNINIRFGFVYIIAYVVIATIPLFAIRTAFRTNHNLAEIERFRVKKKFLAKLILSLSYLTIAILIIAKGWLQ